MPRAKKTFDREEMYRKIMPSASKFQVESIDKECGDDIENTLHQASTINSNAINSAIKNHSLIWMPDCNEKDSIVYNIVEQLVTSALDEVLRKMKNKYYSYRRWKNGMPTKKCLKRLKLI